MFRSILALSPIAQAVIAKRRFATVMGAVPAAGAVNVGVNRTLTEIGKPMTLDLEGTAEVEAGAAIAAGAEVETTAAGKAITKDSGKRVGFAMAAAAEDGSVIEVLLDRE